MAKRRPSGDGMVRKREDGRWEGRIVVGHKKNGTPIFQHAYAHTQKELTEKLHQNIERYDMLSQTYEVEQKQLEAEAITLQQEIEVQERQNENIEKFIQKAHKYVGIEELDGYALRELVSAIYVDAPDKSSGKRVQHIHIKYDGLGFIPLNELMKKETA